MSTAMTVSLLSEVNDVNCDCFKLATSIKSSMICVEEDVSQLSDSSVYFQFFSVDSVNSVFSQLTSVFFS